MTNNIICISLLLFATLSFLSMSKNTFPQGFDYLSNIDPSIIIQPRYAIEQNFVGEVVDGYLKQTVVFSIKAGLALAKVQQDLKKIGFSLVVYDAYRPQKGVNHFIRWSKQPENYKTKYQFYPYLEKQQIIPLGYVAEKSGHSRGSTIDLTIIPLGSEVHEIKLIMYKLNNGQSIIYRDDGTVFMGGHFDYFGQVSHHDCPFICSQCLQSRNLLKSYMEKHGFLPYQNEWWHYTLKDEPFPNTYFDFDII